jgi:hypothetical protein
MLNVLVHLSEVDGSMSFNSLFRRHFVSRFHGNASYLWVHRAKPGIRLPEAREERFKHRAFMPVSIDSNGQKTLTVSTFKEGKGNALE